jgi:carboxymethylenebutenolidase
MASQSYVEIDCGSAGAMSAYLSLPSGPPKGAVIVVQEVFGVTQAIRDIANDIGAKGYIALAPDIFWRIEPGVELGDGLDPLLRQKALDLLSRFDVELGVDDLASAAGYLKTRFEMDRVGIVGFCIGGRMAALTAAVGAVDYASSFYGVGLENYLDRLRNTDVPVQFHFGGNDQHISRDAIEAVTGALNERADRRATVHVYPEAGHAFFNRRRPDMFNDMAFGLARTRLLEFFNENNR